MLLEEVRLAIEATEWPRALDAALQTWRAYRFAELADLVDAIAARCPVPPIPHSRGRLPAWWMTHAMAYEPTMVRVLLEHADDRMLARDVHWQDLVARWPNGNELVATTIASHAYWGRPETNPLVIAWLGRFAALLAWPHDPRVATLFTRWIVDAKCLDVVVRPVVQLLADKLGELGDSRAVAPLRKVIAEPRGASQTIQNIQVDLAHRAITRIGQTRGKDPPPGLLDEARALSALVAPPSVDGAAPIAVEPLWKQVLEEPDNLDARVVLGDALVQRGDTRGELFVLQCVAATTDEQQRRNAARVNRLLKEHWHDWLGDLAQVITRKGSEFRHGMLEAVRVGQTSTPAWAWAKAKGHRELACVHTVRANHVLPAELVKFVMALPRFPHTLELVAPEMIDELVRVAPHMPELRHVTYTQYMSTLPQRNQWPPLEQTLRRLASATPALRILDITTIYPWHAGTQVRDVVPLLPRMFPSLEKIRLAANSLRNMRDDPDALERTQALPLVEIYP